MAIERDFERTLEHQRGRPFHHFVRSIGDEERPPIVPQHFREALAQGRASAFEDRLINTARIVRSLKQERRDRGDQDDAAHAARTVAAQIADYLSRSHRMTDQRNVTKIELLDYARKIV